MRGHFAILIKTSLTAGMHANRYLDVHYTLPPVATWWHMVELASLAFADYDVNCVFSGRY